jgi:hypothetical protein
MSNDSVGWSKNIFAFLLPRFRRSPAGGNSFSGLTESRTDEEELFLCFCQSASSSERSIRCPTSEVLQREEVRFRTSSPIPLSVTRKVGLLPSQGCLAICIRLTFGAAPSPSRHSKQIEPTRDVVFKSIMADRHGLNFRRPDARLPRKFSDNWTRHRVFSGLCRSKIIRFSGLRPD